MRIIGITGTLGAGKGTLVDYLLKKKNFLHFSVRQYLTEEIIRRGLVVNRDSMTSVANDLRANNSPSFIIEELYAEAKKSGRDSIIESIRTPGEIDFLNKQGNFILLAVDADPKLRFERIVVRASETDRIDFETFVANERREMSSKDANKQNLGKCIERADIVLNNNGSIDHLINQLNHYLQD
jgi:dephospho-CoA kinase